MADKKVFTIQIDGVEKSYSDIVKLNEALSAITSINTTVSTSNQEVAASIAEKSKAEQEYEKTIQRLNALESESTRINIEANQQLRERRSEVTAQVTANTAAEGSVKQMQAQLKLLRTQYDNLSAAERENEEVGGDLLKQIQEYDKAVKEAKEATGRFQESVGDYSIAGKAMKQELGEIEEKLAAMILEGINPSSDAFQELVTRAGEIKQSIQDAGASIDTFAQHGQGLNNVISVGQTLTGVFGTAQGVMSMFGQSGEEVEAAMSKMVGVMTTLQSLQELQNQITTKGTLVNTLYAKAMVALGFTKKASVADTTALTAAQGANTVATGGATVATSLFSKALIATGIGAIVVALGLLIANFDDIKKYVLEAVPALNDMGDTMDKLKSVAAGVGEALITYILTPFRVIGAVVKSVLAGDIKGAFSAGAEEVKKGFDVVGNYEKGYQNQSVKNAKAAAIEKAKIRAEELNNLIKDNEAKLGSDWKYSVEGRKAYQALYDAKKLMYADDKDAMKDLQREEWSMLADLTKHDKEEQKKRSDAGAKAAADRKKLLDDYKKALESFNNETHKLDLANEQKKNDTAKAAAEKLTANTKDELTKRNTAIEESYGKQLILNQKLNEDELKAVDKQYDELIKAAKAAKQSTTQIEEEKQLRLTQLREKASLEEIALNEDKNEKIKSSNKTFDDEEKKRIEDSKKQAKDKLDSEVQLIDNQLKNIKELKENAVARSGSFNLINVDTTKKNLQQVKEELIKYKASLEKFKEDTEKNTQIEPSLKQKTLDDIATKIKVTNKDIADNTQQQTQVMSEYWRDFGDKVGGYISVVSDSLGSIFDTMGSFFDAKLEDAQEKLDEITEKYDEAVALQQESNERLLALTEEAKTASGGRALVVQDEIQREMAMNKELANQEKQLRKEKEQAEKNAAKIQKQQKKAELMGNIVSGISGGALAVINAMQVMPFPLGVALAAVAGAMSAVQVGIMSSQLSKLEKGGLLNGKRHSEGGIPVGNTGIEVEGGEYVINRQSTNKNLGLLSYINSQNKELGIGDFISYYDDSTGKIVPTSGFKQMFADGGQMVNLDNVPNQNINNDAILNAINKIDFNPVVSVVDIANAQKQLTTVNDMAGF